MFMKLLWVIAAVATLIGGWRLFEKAGQRGWVAFIPILNLFGLLKMVGKPLWWILFFIPPLFPFTLFFVTVMVARRFGRSALFGVGMYFLPVIFIPLLGLGEARYLGPDAD
jgi:hypothetical protein